AGAVGIPSIELGPTVRIHGEARGPRLGSAERQCQAPAANPQYPVGEIRSRPDPRLRLHLRQCVQWLIPSIISSSSSAVLLIHSSPRLFPDDGEVLVSEPIP